MQLMPLFSIGYACSAEYRLLRARDLPGYPLDALLARVFSCGLIQQQSRSYCY